MKAHKMLTITFLLCYSGAALAGTTGKIRGLVRDAKTGELLPGVNVVISHVWQGKQEVAVRSELGAATSIQGEYIIIMVPPGTYSLTASMLGYAPQTIQQLQVSVDRTTAADFKLQPKVLEGGEVVVTATKDLLQVDVSATENFVTAEQYKNTPFANRIESVLGLQSGVSGSIIEGEIQIRAGQTSEVGFLLDGISMTDKKFNRPVISVQPGTVQEIKIMRNGFNAEYGQSRSGMINVVSKNPGDKYTFAVDYQFDPKHRPHYGRNVYDPDYRWEWRLMAGPAGFSGGELFLPEGRDGIIKTWIGWDKYAQNLLTDKNPNNDLTSQEAFELWKWQHRPMRYGHLNGHNVDATFSGKAPGLPWRANFLLGGKYEYHPYVFPQSRTHYDERIGSLKVVNELTENAKLILNSMYSEVRSITQGFSYDNPLNEDRLSYNGVSLDLYYPYSQPLIDRYTTLLGARFIKTVSPALYYELNLNHFYVKWHISRPDSARAEDGRYFHGRLYYDPQSGWIPKEKGNDDMASGYRMYGGAMIWDDSYNRRTTLSGSMTWQFHPAHEFKGGVEANYDILKEDRVQWLNEDPAQKFEFRYKVRPLEAAVYVQDKIEFQGMIANIGLRLDYFNTNSARPDPGLALTYASNLALLQDYLAGTYPMSRAKPKYYYSPRIGISHPISSHSKIYFNYGHFVQTPLSAGLYTTILDGAMQRVMYMGNPDLPFEKTIAYELGYDVGLSDFFQLHAGAFYKDYYDQYSRVANAHTDYSLVLESPAHDFYSEIRGFEIEVRKTSGKFITGWLNYNYINKSQANLGLPPVSWIPVVTDDPKVGRNGRLWGIPRSTIVTIQPDARGVVTFSAPTGWGPRLWNYPLLHNTNLSLQVFYQSGNQYRHPKADFRTLHPDVWFKELGRYWMNMRLSRLFQIRHSGLEVYADLSNVLHTKFRTVPGGKAGEDYYEDLWSTGRLDQVGTDKVSDPLILRTENQDVYWARLKRIILGLRLVL
jgi:hypothetical protein